MFSRFSLSESFPFNIYSSSYERGVFISSVKSAKYVPIYSFIRSLSARFLPVYPPVTAFEGRASLFILLFETSLFSGITRENMPSEISSFSCFS